MNFNVQLETPRMILRGFNQDTYHDLFANHDQTEIMSILGISTQEEFDLELFRYKGGYSTYNLTQVLPLVKGTALEKVIISDYLRYALPSLGTRHQKIYRTSVVAQDLALQLLQGTLERLMQGVPQPDGTIAVAFQPQEIQQFQQTYAGYQQAYGVLGDPSGGTGSMANMPSDQDTTTTPSIQSGEPISGEEQPGDFERPIDGNGSNY